MLTASAVVALAFAFPQPLRADGDIPSYKVLSCEVNCPAFTPAVPISNPQPTYPPLDTGRSGLYEEAMVHVRLTVAADGGVKDAEIVELIGPPEFGESALNAVRRWKFQPATANGQPVEQTLEKEFFFQISDPIVGAREEVVRAYRNATSLAHQQKMDDAIAELKNILAKPKTNFYERTMAAYGLATIYANTGNYPLALEQIRDATISEGQFIDRHEREAAIRLRISLEASSGQIADAFAWFEILRKRGTVGVDDPTAKMISALHATLDSSAPLVMEVVVPAAEGNPPWWHTLLRRSFSFAGVTGKLDTFKLRCQGHSIESAVSEKAEWTVPKSWSDCVIYVAGTPGTKFQFVELIPLAPAKPNAPAP